MRAKWTILKSYLRTKYLRRFRSREHLLAWQDQQVQRFLRKILPRSPFYQSYFARLSIEQWQQFPMIDKALMMEHFDELNTLGISKEKAFALALPAEQSRDFSPTLNRVTVGLSSGTSGNQGLFLVSPEERNLWAGAILAKALPGSLFERNRVALFLRANSSLYSSIRSRWILFEYFDLLSPLEQHLKHLNELQPTILVAPASMLRMLAHAQSEHALRIAPRKIISVAEVLDPLDEAYIRQHFSQIVHQIYQCTEGFLASTCEYGTLHLNEDVVAIQREYLDVQLRKFVPIITDFHRTTQPIIRYRLNDILTERASPCPCGSVMTALECIEGRCDDLFYLRPQNKNEWIPLFPDFVRRAVITSSSDVEAYIVRQLAPAVLEIALKVSGPKRANAQQSITQSLNQLYSRLGCDIPEIHYIELPKEQPGLKKLKRVVRSFSLEEYDSASHL